MIIRFSIVLKDEDNELFAYQSEKNESMIDIDLIRGFMRAFQRSSKGGVDIIDRVIFSNLVLYVNDYNNLSIRILVNQELGDQELKRCFERLYNETTSILEAPLEDKPLSDVFQEKLVPILVPIIEDPLAEKASLKPLDILERDSKIAMVGLHNAGKTSILKLFFDNWTTEMIKNIRATIGLDISRKFQEFLDTRFVVLDFGGQEKYQKEHLSREMIWSELSALIFVVDIQDIDLFEVSRTYLDQIWRIVTQTNEKPPKLSVFFHKYDKSKKNELEGNLRIALDTFNDYSHFASFSLTTIEESKISNVALLRTLYFSLPEIILPQLLKTEFLAYFEAVVLPKFLLVYETEKLDIISDQKEREKWEKWAQMLGINLGMYFQKSWYDFNTGKGAQARTSSLSKSIKIVQKAEERAIYFTIPNAELREFPEDAWKALINGFLGGLLKTFQLPSAEILETAIHTEWRINY
ncbi:MAG: ADP-ribosylation factor-like protein [Candidatus Hodarchaeota archaeon]